MKIIYNIFIPFKGYKYMNIFGVLFGRLEAKGTLKQSDVNHESIHSEQYKDLVFILFLPLYLLEWLIKIPFSWFYNKTYQNGRKVTKVAYRSISLEQEAFYHQYDFNYLDKRKRYNWIKYIFTMYDPDKQIPLEGIDNFVI